MPEESATTSNPYGPQGEVVKGIGFDPLAPPEVAFELEGKLVYQGFERASDEYAARSDGKRPTKWRQVFEAQDVVRSDGTPAVFSNSPSVTQGDGVTPLGEGSAMHFLATAWKGTKGVEISMNPDDVRSEAFLGRVFKLKSKRLKVGTDRVTKEPFYVRLYLPVEIMPVGYQYVGEKRVLKDREAEDAGVAPAGVGATAQVDKSTNDAEVAAKLAALLVQSGADRTTAQDAVFADAEMKATPELWGMSIISRLVPPKAPLIDELIQRGYLTENGTGKFALGTTELAEAPAAATS